MSALPATLMSGLGVERVSGRMRRPSPAASTIAVRGLEPVAAMASAFLAVEREVAFIPEGNVRQNRMAEGTTEIGPDAWQVAQIIRLAVAGGEARKNAENLGRPLGSHNRIGLLEGRAIERRCLAAPGDIGVDQVLLEFLTNAD